MTSDYSYRQIPSTAASLIHRSYSPHRTHFLPLPCHNHPSTSRTRSHILRNPAAAVENYAMRSRRTSQQLQKRVRSRIPHPLQLAAARYTWNTAAGVELYLHRILVLHLLRLPLRVLHPNPKRIARLVSVVEERLLEDRRILDRSCRRRRRRGRTIIAKRWRDHSRVMGGSRSRCRRMRRERGCT